MSRYCLKCAHRIGEYDKSCAKCGRQVFVGLDTLLVHLMQRIETLEANQEEILEAL